MIHELLGQLAARKETFGDNPVSVAQMGESVDMVLSGNMTGVYIVVCSADVAHGSQGRSGKALLHHMVTLRSTAKLESKLSRELGLLAVSDGSLLKTWCVVFGGDS